MMDHTLAEASESPGRVCAAEQFPPAHPEALEGMSGATNVRARAGVSNPSSYSLADRCAASRDLSQRDPGDLAVYRQMSDGYRDASTLTLSPLPSEGEGTHSDERRPSSKQVMQRAVLDYPGVSWPACT